MTQFQPADEQERSHGHANGSWHPSRQAVARPGTPSLGSSLALPAAAEARHSGTGSAATSRQPMKEEHALSLFGLYADQKEDWEGQPTARPTFTPPVGIKETVFVGAYGVFKATHGLIKAPTKEAPGVYSMRIEMTPDSWARRANIGFIQAFRVSDCMKEWSTEKGDAHLSDEESRRVSGRGWLVDQPNLARDKTPFHGMHKSPTGALHATAPTRLGRQGGPTAIFEDTREVHDPEKIELTATAMDPATGETFGSVGWGFSMQSGRRSFIEETPRLIDKESNRGRGRDEAFERWNRNVAGKAGCDAIPGYGAG